MDINDLWIKIHEILDGNAIARGYQISVDKVFEEYLGKDYFKVWMEKNKK